MLSSWAHFRWVIYCNSSILQHIIYIYIYHPQKKHCISYNPHQSTISNHHPLSHDIPPIKCLVSKTPHLKTARVVLTVGCDGRRQTTRKMSSDRKKDTQRAEGKRGAMGETYGAGPKTNRISPKIWDGFRWFRAKDEFSGSMPWVSQVSFLAFTGATSVVIDDIDGIPGIEESAGLSPSK